MKNTAAVLKKRLFISSTVVLLLLCLLSFETVAQQSDISKSITGAIRSGDASKLALHLNVSVDLTLPGNEGTYSKKQSEQILKMFFSKNPCKDFSLDHTGNSNSGTIYMIGSYKTNSGKKFRVYLLLKSGDRSNLIQQLQFEEEGSK